MKLLKFLFLSLFLFPALLAINAFRFQYGLEDAFWRTLMSPLEGTVWAANFNESAFAKIQVGMLAGDALRLIGEPIRRDCDNDGCLWIYSWQDTSTADFDQRWILLDTKERITEIRKSFFID